VVRGGDGGGFGTIAAAVLFSSLQVLSLRLLENTVCLVFL